ncbi:MAG: hypothetical protein ABR978_07580 [Dehalococcoidia bacterium]|jgi:hypothetical protein
MNLQDLRDLIIVIVGILGILVLFVTLIVVIVVGFATRGLIAVAKGVLKEQLSPTLESARQVVDDVRGTTSFIADTAVSPIIRVYGLLNGVKRGIAALAGLGRRRRG